MDEVSTPMRERKSRTNYLLPVALVLILVLALVGGIRYMREALMKLTIDERSYQLEEMVTQIRANLNSGLQTHWNLVSGLNNAVQGSHYANGDEVCQSIAHLEKYYPGKGEEYATKLRDYTIALYKKCADYALSRGIIIADTKFEFGLDEDGNVVLGDEMLTPDSSRFWPADGYEPGHGQPSFDKQFARDWLKANPGNDWTLPQEIVDKTIAKYEQAYEMLTGKSINDV